jgi:hypothetical protein
VVDWPFGPLVKLMLTTQRRDEVATMEWLELDIQKRNWTLPREKAKNNRAHEVQLSDGPRSRLLESVRRIGDSLIFTVTDETPVFRVLSREIENRR